MPPRPQSTSTAASSPTLAGMTLASVVTLRCKPPPHVHALVKDSHDSRGNLAIEDNVRADSAAALASAQRVARLADLRVGCERAELGVDRRQIEVALPAPPGRLGVARNVLQVGPSRRPQENARHGSRRFSRFGAGPRKNRPEANGRGRPALSPRNQP